MFSSKPGNCFSRLYSLRALLDGVSLRAKAMRMVLGVFYQQRMKHRVRTKITELFLSLKLLVFIDLELLLIVDVLGWF